MTAGQRNNLVYVEKQLPGEDDGFGNVTPGGWGPIETTWARILPLKGSETVIAARRTGIQPVIITIPITPDNAAITREWRVRHADTGRLYDISSVANMDEHGAEWELLAEYQT
ncbi:head-tail adaptor protein [Rhizobium sp. Rhizsp82]|uniref:head-tail adaptor protein n=1 Tax=Rhizobium sp. Rhizsp82 TaxID=3243057 RepID=UPI0039B5A954